MKIGILAIALIVASSVFGQAPEGKAKERKTPEERATGMTERMTKKLGLSEDQKNKIYDINIGIAKKNDAIRSDAAASKEDKMKRIQENHQTRNSMYKEVLTPEQYAKYEAWEKEKIAKMAEKRAANKAAKGKKGAKGSKAKTPEGETEETEEEL